LSSNQRLDSLHNIPARKVVAIDHVFANGNAGLVSGDARINHNRIRDATKAHTN
jgi:hypothetical protein